MNKLSYLDDSSFKNNENKKSNDSSHKLEKILCNHCGRSANNGIRCQGFCVADSEY